MVGFNFCQDVFFVFDEGGMGVVESPVVTCGEGDEADVVVSHCREGGGNASVKGASVVVRKEVVVRAASTVVTYGDPMGG